MKKVCAVLKKIYPVFILMMVDIASIAISFGFALWVRFEFHISEIPIEYIDTYASCVLYWAAACILVFTLFRLYNSILGFVSLDTLLRIAGAYTVHIRCFALWAFWR